MSFARAADELSVTPAALSFQIKSLEQHLGQPVFHRLNRAVKLTAAGQALLPGTRDGFAALNAAWRAARRSGQTNSISVTAGPMFTSAWLAPRMVTFATAHPDIEMRLSASLKQEDFDRDGIDVAIRFGGGKDVGLFARTLLREWMVPMMSPALASQHPTAQSLASAPLLHDESTVYMTPTPDWPAWFDRVGVTGAPRIAARFSNADHAIEAAMAGAGVLLGRGTLAARALLDGRLVAPFKQALDTQSRFRMLCQMGQESQPNIAAFMDWMEAEVAPARNLAEGFEMHPF